MGVDIGTSGCKAVVFDEAGNLEAAAYREYNIISPYPGWAELDTDEVIARCFDVIKESASAIGKEKVAGIGISSQGEAFTLVDSKGKTLCNALVSSDIRANDLIQPWTEQFGLEKLYRITGHTPHPMFSLFKLLWLKKNEPAIWDEAFRILCFEDLLQFRLGISDPSMGWPLAGRTMLFDVVQHCWDGEILSRAGIRKEMLSKPLQSGSFAGSINKDIASSLRLSNDTFVVTGGHDQTCSGLGAGAVDPGIAVYTSGTVECITPAFDRPVFTGQLQKGNLCTYDHAAQGMYATVAFSLTGGNLLKWFRDEFGRDEMLRTSRSSVNAYELLLEQMPDRPSGLLVLPYFTPSGTPYFDVKVKGSILGLDLSVKREEILRALLEGVAYEMRLNLDILQQSGCHVNELRIIGGGARSVKHVQLKSDVTGMPVVIMDVTEAGCLGAAILARSYASDQNSCQIAKKWAKPISRIEPGNKAHYDAGFQQYKKLFPLLKSIY